MMINFLPYSLQSLLPSKFPPKCRLDIHASLSSVLQKAHRIGSESKLNHQRTKRQVVRQLETNIHHSPQRTLACKKRNKEKNDFKFTKIPGTGLAAQFFFFFLRILFLFDKFSFKKQKEINKSTAFQEGGGPIVRRDFLPTGKQKVPQNVFPADVAAFLCHPKKHPKKRNRDKVDRLTDWPKVWNLTLCNSPPKIQN